MKRIVMKLRSCLYVLAQTQTGTRWRRINVHVREGGENDRSSSKRKCMREEEGNEGAISTMN